MLLTALRLALSLLALTAAMGCDSEDPDRAPDGALRVLFIGNSLTYTNDLPAAVTALAGALGERPVHARAAVAGNFSLADHWFHGDARKRLEDETWDVVVLQQGPSSLEENQEHLKMWAQHWARAIRDAGARPALYMVWPESARSGAFPAVEHSYRNAAEAADALLFPAGAAWRIAMGLDPGLRLYGSDGFHPSPLGTALAALTIYVGLFERYPDLLPETLPVGREAVALLPHTGTFRYAIEHAYGEGG